MGTVLIENEFLYVKRHFAGQKGVTYTIDVRRELTQYEVKQLIVVLVGGLMTNG